MNQEEVRLIDSYSAGKLSVEDLRVEFGSKIDDKQFVKKEILSAIDSRSAEQVDQAMTLIQVNQNYDDYVVELNQLLLSSNHTMHQELTMILQKIASPESVPYIEEMLAKGFDDLQYTCSEDGVIAKWFSWALACIGTEEAIRVIEKYSNSNNLGISSEMKYRLERIKK